jgi:hypothetical protein
LGICVNEKVGATEVQITGWTKRWEAKKRTEQSIFSLDFLRMGVQ